MFILYDRVAELHGALWPTWVAGLFKKMLNANNKLQLSDLQKVLLTSKVA